MLNMPTQAAIAALHDIHSGAVLQSSDYSLSREEWGHLLHRLETGGIIRLTPGGDASSVTSYTLCRPLGELSLLDVLEATGEPINCHRPTSEDFYLHHAIAAQRIGVLNRVARIFLSEVRISDW